MMDLAQASAGMIVKGEHNKYFYKSIGTGVTIPPVELPRLTIMAGATFSNPVVAGNTKCIFETGEDDTPCRL